MLLRTRNGTRAETWTLRCGRPRQKSAEPLVLGIDRRLLRCLYCTMDRVEKLGTNISLAIAREASAAPQPPLREKLPGSNSTYPSTVPGTCSDRNTRESQKAPVVSVRMRATRLCSYRTIAIKQKRHASSCKALLQQPYAASPAGYPKSISSRTIFGDRESTITAAAAAAACYAATTQPPQTAPSTFFPRKVTCWSYAVAWRLAAQSGVAGCLALRLPLWRGC